MLERASCEERRRLKEVSGGTKLQVLSEYTKLYDYIEKNKDCDVCTSTAASLQLRLSSSAGSFLHPSCCPLLQLSLKLPLLSPDMLWLHYYVHHELDVQIGATREEAEHLVNAASLASHSHSSICFVLKRINSIPRKALTSASLGSLGCINDKSIRRINLRPN